MITAVLFLTLLMPLHLAAQLGTTGAVADASTAAPQARPVGFDELRQLALERNAELLAVRQEIAVARGLLTQGQLRPNPGLDVMLESGRPLGSPGERTFEVSYAHTFELGGKRDRRIEVGRIGVEMAELEVADRERMLTVEIRTRYADALAAARNLATLAQVAELNDQGYRVVERRVTEGEAPAVERSLMQSELGRVKADRLMAAATTERTLSEIKLSAGLPMSEAIRLGGDLSVPPVLGSLDELIARALESRPDLNASRQQRLRGESAVRLSQAERTPNVIGLARYTQSDTHFNALGLSNSGQLIPLRDTDHTLTFGISIPLQLFNRNQGTIAAEQAQLEASRHRQDFAEQRVRVEVAAAYTRYVAARQAQEIFDQEVVRQAQQSVRTFRTSYELGELPLLDLIQEQRRLIEIEKAYTDILKEHYVARAALEAAVGGDLR
jgi:cobalt-zinc-cadmium efflux system outer membrane protein